MLYFYTLFKIDILDLSAAQICSMAQHLDGHDNTVGTFTIEMLFEIAKNSSNTQVAKTRRGNDQIKSTRLLRLTSVNAHPRDARISFDEEKHLYFLDNKEKNFFIFSKLCFHAVYFCLF